MTTTTNHDGYWLSCVNWDHDSLPIVVSVGSKLSITFFNQENGFELRCQSHKTSFESAFRWYPTCYKKTPLKKRVTGNGRSILITPISYMFLW